MSKRVYIAYTGGTIGMNRARGGYCPEPGYLQRQMAQMPELGHPSMPSYTIHEYAPLLDSSNMTPRYSPGETSRISSRTFGKRTERE